MSSLSISPPCSPIASRADADATADSNMTSSPGSFVAHYPRGTVQHNSETTDTDGVRRIVKRTYVDGKRVKKTETIIYPNNSAASADPTNDDKLDWSPRSAQSVPSLLGGADFRERTGSELTFDKCFDPVILETSSSILDAPRQLVMPELEESLDDQKMLLDTAFIADDASSSTNSTSNSVGASVPLGRFSTPPRPTIIHKGDDTAATATTAATVPVSPSPPSTPEPRRLPTSADNTPVRSNSNLPSTYRQRILNEHEAERKRNLKAKNWLRRLAKSVRKV